MNRIELLDHGYIELIKEGCWGSDEIIIESARMSTDGGFRGWEDIIDEKGNVRKGDQHLLSYLWKHKHFTPFEMAGLTIEVQAPIMVFREWHRHRTQSYNEMSGRYIQLPNLTYLPSAERAMAGKQAEKNKQGSQEGFTEAQARWVRGELQYVYQVAQEAYQRLLDYGVAKEVARLVLPVAQYSRMRASGNLRNWLGFLALRMDPAAQWEIRQYANAVAIMVAELFPRTYQLALGERNGN